MKQQHQGKMTAGHWIWIILTTLFVMYCICFATRTRGEPNNCLVDQQICNPNDPTECEQYGRVWSVFYDDIQCPPTPSPADEMRVYFYYAENHGPWIPQSTCPNTPPGNLCTSVDELVWSPHNPVYVECTPTVTGEFRCPAIDYPLALLKIYDYPMLRPGREYTFATRWWMRNENGDEWWTPGYTIMYDPWRNPELECQQPPYTSTHGSDICWPEYMECPAGVSSNLECTIHYSE